MDKYTNKYEEKLIKRYMHRKELEEKKKKNTNYILFLIISVICFLGLYSYYAQMQDSENLSSQNEDKSYITKENKDVINEEEIKCVIIDEDSVEVAEAEEIIEQKHIENSNIREDYYDIIKTIGCVDQRYVDIVNEKLSLLPPVLVEQFIEEGWYIYITTEDIASTYCDNKYSSVLAITDYKRKRIIVEDRDNIEEGTIEHEFGHILDYFNGKPCWSNEFMQIYSEEVNQFKEGIPNSSCVRNEQEFFAETFCYLIIDDSKCTPKAKEFVKQTLIETISLNGEDTY